MERLKDHLVIAFVLFVALYAMHSAGAAMEEAVEYKKVPAKDQHCVQIHTSDMGVMYMCEK